MNPDSPLVLLPTPRRIDRQPGTFALKPGQFIGIATADVFSTAELIQRAGRAAGVDWQIVAGSLTRDVAVTLSLDSAELRHESYQLLIRPDEIRLIASSPAGLFYAAQTLVQILRQCRGEIPCMEIEDWPDFAARGVMLDISRDKVPTMQTLYDLVDRLAEWKINQLQLYTEHTFAYRNHAAVWQHASPMTGEEILRLDEYCRRRFIELVPNQNSFGHMERWLKHADYRDLAEAPDGAQTPWGFFWKGPFSLCPTNVGSIALLSGLYRELLPHFRSKLFNVGCDETFDLGAGKSKTECERRGTTRVYLDFLNQIHYLVFSQGRRMMFWGDIILHNPELIAELPKDVIALEWGYEANHPFDRDGALFAKAGVPFYVCPGTSSWCTIAGRTDNAIGNLRNAAASGLSHGAIGYLNTDWGDHGHMQYLPISYLGLAVGAAYSWCLESNLNLPLPDALDRHVFFDSAGVMGKVAIDLGNVYQSVGKLVGNGSALFRILVPTAAKSNAMEGITADGLAAAQAAIDAAVASLGRAAMAREDAVLIVDEFQNAAAMLRHACRRGRWKLDAAAESAAALEAELRDMIATHRRLWLARNRPGGLPDSTKRLEDAAADYPSAAANR
jgi:hypothetical protein